MAYNTREACSTWPSPEVLTDLRQAEQTLHLYRVLKEDVGGAEITPGQTCFISSQNTEVRCSVAKLEHLVGTAVPNSSAMDGPMHFWDLLIPAPSIETLVL